MYADKQSWVKTHDRSSWNYEAEKVESKSGKRERKKECFSAEAYLT